MPELPEVQTVVNTLAPRATGARIQRALLLRNDILTPANCQLAECISGRKIISITRRAKRIVFQLDDSNRFYIHLGMSGRLGLEPPDAVIAKHTHLILTLKQPNRASFQLRFIDPRRFGGVWWLGSEIQPDDLGPEPLAITAGQLRAQIDGTKRVIKSVLLDQRVIAGLGNIYVDESLHDAGIHPLTRAHRLRIEPIERLAKSIRQVLRRALKHRGSTLRDYVDAEGTPGDFQNVHRVYDRAGLPCLRCGEPIRRIIVGGRSTHFCLRCQPRRQSKNALSVRLSD